MTEIEILAQKLGIAPAQLAKLRVKHKTDEKLVIWLRVTEAHFRDRRRLLSRRSVPPYTETPSQALPECGEAVPPDEIASYRKSREARDNYQAEQMDEVGILMAAMRLVRDSLDALPPEKKAASSRSIWAFKGRMDALEREIRRRLAA